MDINVSFVRNGETFSTSDIASTKRHRGYSKGLSLNVDDKQIIDAKGKVVADLSQYSELYGFFDNATLIVAKEDKYGLYRYPDGEITTLIYDEIGDFIYGTAHALKDGKYGLIDTNGNEVMPFNSDVIDGLRYGISIQRITDQTTGRKLPLFMLYDKDGQLLSMKVYTGVKATYFGEELLCVARDGKWGFIDNSGKEVLPCQYPEETYFQYDVFAKILKDPTKFDDLKRYMFIDKTGTNLADYLTTKEIELLNTSTITEEEMDKYFKIRIKIIVHCAEVRMERAGNNKELKREARSMHEAELAELMKTIDKIKAIIDEKTNEVITNNSNGI